MINLSSLTRNVVQIRDTNELGARNRGAGAGRSRYNLDRVTWPLGGGIELIPVRNKIMCC